MPRTGARNVRRRQHAGTCRANQRDDGSGDHPLDDADREMDRQHERKERAERQRRNAGGYGLSTTANAPSCSASTAEQGSDPGPSRTGRSPARRR